VLFKLFHSEWLAENVAQKEYSEVERNKKIWKKNVIKDLIQST